MGSFIFAWVVAQTGAFDAELRPSFDELAAHTMSHPFGVTVLRGLFAGWLIALMVWLLPAAETARIWVIVILTYVVDGVFHFPHIIAGASESFYLALTGTRRWSEVLGGFILPVLIGNTVGGVTLVAALAHAQIVGDKKKHREAA